MSLQEIGPRFTLKLRSLKKGLPAVFNYGEDAKPIEFDVEAASAQEAEGQAPKEQDEDAAVKPPTKTIPPKQEEVIWAWKVCSLMLPPSLFTNLFTLAGTGDKQKNILPLGLFSSYLVYLCLYA